MSPTVYNPSNFHEIRSPTTIYFPTPSEVLDFVIREVEFGQSADGEGGLVERISSSGEVEVSSAGGPQSPSLVEARRYDYPTHTIRTISHRLSSPPHHLTPATPAHRLLQRFAFPSARWADDVARLSGGERRRLQLLSTLARRPNFLVLDEPTNDLDLMTLGVLEDYLETFKGVVVIVSHDRWFMDRVVGAKGGSLFVFEGEGEVRAFTGTYSEYIDFENHR